MGHLERTGPGAVFKADHKGQDHMARRSDFDTRQHRGDAAPAQSMDTDVSSPTKPRVTVVTPAYNEEASLPAYVAAVTGALLGRNDFEVRVLFVDDGSDDGTWLYLSELCRADARFRAIRLSRNFGAHAALHAGLAEADGDAVATLACDLQDPPEVILEFLARWQEGAQIVWGRRASRDDGRWREAASRICEATLRRYAMPKRSCFTVGSFILLDRQVVECLRQYPERRRVTFALVAWTGFTQAVVDYHRRRRQAGSSGWTPRQMLTTMYDAFLGFSPAPIRLMTWTGVGAFMLCLALGVYLVIDWIAGRPLKGWTSIMLAVSFFSGLQLLLTGLVGEYLYRIHVEVMQRPTYFIAAATGSSSADRG